MTENQRACEFEALVCETNAIGAEVAAMKALNKERLQDGYALAYSEKEFSYAAAQFREMAAKFRALAE